MASYLIIKKADCEVGLLLLAVNCNHYLVK